VEDGERDDELASVETSGASVDEAIQQALDQLDLTPEDVDVEVLDPGGSGRPARVRVTELPYEDEDEDVEELEALA